VTAGEFNEILPRTDKPSVEKAQQNALLESFTIKTEKAKRRMTTERQNQYNSVPEEETIHQEDIKKVCDTTLDEKGNAGVGLELYFRFIV
jgi:DNA repair exonuclease SbcCD nuclease subunit